MTHGKDPRAWAQYLPDVQLGINTKMHDVTKEMTAKCYLGVALRLIHRRVF